jgi:myo-inositol-1-phosphate synthase
VGRPLSEAIFSAPNCALRFHEPPTHADGILVEMGPVHDGIASHMASHPDGEAFRVSSAAPVTISERLRDTRADVLVSYMPVGADRAAKEYATACLDAGVAMVNCSPTFIASDPQWATRFATQGVPIIGDDVKSQMGATISHRVLARLAEERGIRIRHMYQLNVGGNTDFLNMLARDRLASKKKSKTDAVQSQLAAPLPAHDIHVGPSDYVPWLHDNKVCFLRIEGEGFGGVGVDLELRLSVQDSPNSAGVVVDAVRCAKLALERGRAGALQEVCAYLMKSPPVQQSDDEARRAMATFIEAGISVAELENAIASPSLDQR